MDKGKQGNKSRITPVILEVNQEQTKRFKASIFSVHLYQFLRNTFRSEPVTYAEMSNEIGIDIRKHMHYLSTAKKWLEQYDLISFRTIPRVGIQHMNPGDILDESRKDIFRLGNKCKRVKRRLNCVKSDDFLNLTPDQRNEFTVQMSLFGIGEYITQQQQLNLLQQRVTPQFEAPNPKEAIKKLIERRKN